MTYNKCMESTLPKLKKRGFDNHEQLAAEMCNMWADENGVERIADPTKAGIPVDAVNRSFALSLGDSEDMTFSSEDNGLNTISFPVIAITSGLHTYEDKGKEEKVYIEPTVLKSNIEAFNELPIYLNHQRTPEDLIGMATDPEAFEMENGKTGMKMSATINNKTGHGQEVMNKIKDGDMTHVSIDWLSNDVDVMGDNYATNIRPTEVSFIDNEKMDPVCKECTIDMKCVLHVEDEHHDCGCGGDGACKCEDGETEVETMTVETNVKSDAENIVEREFASLRSQLEELQASKKEIETQYEESLKMIESFKVTEETRLAEEAEARKVSAIDSIISKEMLFNVMDDETKNARVDELSAWDEMKLTGFSEGLATIPAPEDAERQFGRGKANDGEAVPEVKRESVVNIDNTGRFRIDQSKLRGN